MRYGLRLVAMLAVGLFLAGCGSSSQPASSSSPATGKNASAAGQKGVLTAQEYRLMMRAARKARQADKARDPDASAAKMQEACRALENAPSQLLQDSHAGCVSLVAFVTNLVAFARDGGFCTNGDPQAVIDCLKHHMKIVADSGRTAITTATAANRAARARAIHGRCRDVIGASSKDLRFMSHLTHAASSWNQAVDRIEPIRMESTQKRLLVTLRDYKSSGGNAVKQVRTCR